MNCSKHVLITWRSAIVLLLVINALPSVASDGAGPIVTGGRWEDSFDDATGLEDLNQTLVDDGAVRLNGDVHQVWEISSQVSFQAGELDHVDAEAVPGALQLAPAELSFDPNQLVSDVSLYHYFEPPALAGDGDQVLHLAWAHTEEDDIFYRCSTDAGQSWTAIESLSDGGATALQRAPEMLVASTGQVYAAWHDERLDENGDVYLASRPGCQGSWSAHTPVTVAATTGPAQDDPALAIDHDDNLYLAWEEDDAIYFSRSDDGGQSWSARHKLNDESGAVASSPDILVSPAGQKVLVAWDYDPDSAESNIYFAASDDGGQTWSINLPVAPDPTDGQYYPAVARSPDGALYVAWAGGGIYVSRSLDGGQMWGPAVPVHDEQFVFHWSGTSLAVDNQGTLYLTWHDKRHRVNPIYQPSNYYDVFVAYSQDGGQSWSANIQLNDDPPLSGAGSDRIDHMYPAVTINQSGQFFAAWWDERGMCEDEGGTITCISPHKEIYFVSTPGYAFATHGDFTSAVHDTGGPATWDAIAWTATTPPNTALTLHTRSGDTPVPDAGWSGWSPAYSGPGQPVASPRARYVQVQAVLTTTDPLTTPVLYDVTLYYRPFIWEQTTQADFAGSMLLQNVDVTALPGSVQLSPNVAFSPEQRVNDQLDHVVQVDSRPAMAVVGDSVYLAWQDTRDDSEGDIFFARSTDGGQAWGPNIQVNDDLPGVEQSAPYLAARGNDVYLAWHDEREGGEGDVYFARSTNGGQSWSANQRVNGNTFSVVGAPAIATGAGSRLHATWATSKTLIYTNRSADAGQSWGGNVAVGGADLGASSFTGYPAPGIATNGSGDVYLAWWDTRNAFYDESCMRLRDIDVFAGRSTNNGSSWSAGVQITGDDGLASQSRPHLAYRDGTLFAVWTDFRDAALSDDRDPAIYFARSADGGQSWSPTNLQVNTNEVPHVALDPVVAVDDEGVLYVSWRGDYLDSARDVFFTRSLDSGDTWQVERRVNTDAIGAEQGAPALVATTPGRVYLAWHDERAGTQDLYFTTSLSGVTYTSGMLTSSVLDTEGAAQWGDVTWTATVPPGTSLILYTRSGNTTNPDDGTWSDWSAGYTSSPAPISSPPARYLQYRADLATTDPYTTPVLHDVSVEYGCYPLQGSAVSFPVLPPTGFGEWQTVTFDAYILPGTTLTVDVLDSEGNVLLEDVDSGASLTGYPPAQHPGLRLRVNLTTSDPTVTPALNDWALTWRPPPAENHIRVINEHGEPAGGVDIYHSGSFLGTTDHLGLLDLPGPPQLGDTLSALQPLAETPTSRDVHEGWAYRTYITNIEVAAQGIPRTFVVSQPGTQVLVVRPENTLVLFNLVVSVEWDAMDEYIEEIARAVQYASDYLYDLTDGQMAFSQVVIYDNGEYWTDADVQISTKNIVRPHAYVGGITSDDKSHVIRVGRGWDGHSGAQGPWDAPDGYRTLAHEFGHYALHLYDEYFAFIFDHNGNLIDEVKAYCTMPKELLPEDDAASASVMYYQYKTSELSARDVPGMWSTLCEQTAQWQLNGESAWETLVRMYADTESPPRWRFITPADRGSVMAGPAGVPPDLLPFPQVTVHNGGRSGPPRWLTVYGPDGEGYWGAIVALYKQDGSGRVIGQGFTDGNGRLKVYGADDGDRLQAVSMDGGLASRVAVGAEASLTLSLAPVGGLATQAAGGIPHVRVIAEPSQYQGQVDLLLFLQGFGPDVDLLSVFITEPGSEVRYAPPLSYSPAIDTYEGEHSFSATRQGMGHIEVGGLVGGSRVRLQSTYRLQRVFNGQDQDVYSNDGNLSLYLEPGSLPGDEAYFVVMPPGAVPGSLPDGLLLVGDPYNVTASGALEVLEKPGILTLHYDGALVNPSLMPEGLGIYRWDPNSETWQVVPGSLDEEQRAMVASVTNLGTYALLAPPGPWTEPPQAVIFLPIILKRVQ